MKKFIVMALVMGALGWAIVGNTTTVITERLDVINSLWEDL